MVKLPKVKVFSDPAVRLPDDNVSVITGGATLVKAVVPAGPAGVKVVTKLVKVPPNVPDHPVRVMITRPGDGTAATGVRDTVITTVVAPAMGLLKVTLTLPKLSTIAGMLTAALYPSMTLPLVMEAATATALATWVVAGTCMPAPVMV